MNTRIIYYYLEDVKKVAKEEDNVFFIYRDGKWWIFRALADYLIGNNKKYRNITEDEAEKLTKGQ